MSVREVSVSVREEGLIQGDTVTDPRRLVSMVTHVSATYILPSKTSIHILYIPLQNLKCLFTELSFQTVYSISSLQCFFVFFFFRGKGPCNPLLGIIIK